MGGAATEAASSQREPVAALTNAQRTERAVKLWQECQPAAASLVESYLRARGVTIAVPPSIRFHPALLHPMGGNWPAMVAAVQGTEGQIVAVHRTFLARDGKAKAAISPDKMMLGPCAGGAVRFARPADTLAVCEGVETGLSIHQACPGLAVWASLSTSGMTTLRLPDSVETVILAVDNDANGAGDRAGTAAAFRFRRMGRCVKIARPPRSGSDFNDMLRAYA
jgi:hypothetical protein